jgi:hypothetical protein
LVHDPYLAVFDTPMSCLIKIFCARDRETGQSENALALLRLILAKWPVTCSGKQELLLGYLARAVGSVTMVHLMKFALPLGQVLRETACSPCEKVASRSLQLWSRPEGEILLREVGRALSPMLLPYVVQVSNTHWSSTVRSNARIAMGALQKGSLKKAALAALPESRTEAPQFATWSAICALAVSADPGIGRVEKMGEICALFGGGGNFGRMRASESAILYTPLG